MFCCLVREVVPAAGQYWVNEFKVEKSDTTVTVKVFPTECGLDVPKIVVHGWKTDLEMIESKNCSSSSNKTNCGMQKCTTELVQVCANQTVNVTGPNCTHSNNNGNNSSSNTTTAYPCQQNNTASIIQDCRYENITTCEKVMETNKLPTNESLKNKTSSEAPLRVVFADPDHKGSILVVSTVEVPSGPVFGHFVLKYTNDDGESFFTKSMINFIFHYFYDLRQIIGF